VHPSDVESLLETLACEGSTETAGSRGRRQIDDAVAGASLQVGAGKGRTARDLPLNAEIGVRRRVQLDDQRLDVDLRTPRPTR
jgi:hypothetical protein